MLDESLIRLMLGVKMLTMNFFTLQTITFINYTYIITSCVTSPPPHLLMRLVALGCMTGHFGVLAGLPPWRVSVFLPVCLCLSVSKMVYLFVYLPLFCLLGAMYHLCVLCYRNSSWRPSMSVYFTLDPPPDPILFYFFPLSLFFF